MLSKRPVFLQSFWEAHKWAHHRAQMTIMHGVKIARLPEYDYRSDGYYFVTIVCDYRRPLLQSKHSLVQDILQKTADGIPGVVVDTSIIMPNHVHIIFQLDHCRFQLGEIVRRFKAKTSHALGQTTWQSNYYEHIIRSEQALNKIREYIMLNPEIARLRVEAGNYKRKVT